MQRYVPPQEPSLPLVITWSCRLCFLFDRRQKLLPPVMLAAFPASATIPATSGDATLVPQTLTQSPAYCESYSATPGSHPACAEMSEIVRPVQSGSCCHDGLVTSEHPAPAPSQTVSLYFDPLSANCVPPTASTLVSAAGHKISLYPSSPEEAKYAIPGVS